jgi:hypothetical protein
MQPTRKAVCWQAACFLSLILCLLLLAGCGKNKEATRNRNQAVMPTSAAREKEIEQARAEAQAYLAAKSASPAAPLSKAAKRQLTNAQLSAEDLSRNFLKALANNDMDSIKALRLTKEEFCQYVFPELPASKLPNVTCDFVWHQATLKSLGGLSEMYPEHKGKKYQFVALRFEKGTDSYPTYKVHKETHVVVRDEIGRQQELRLFGSLLEMDGKYKLFSFVID